DLSAQEVGLLGWDTGLIPPTADQTFFAAPSDTEARAFNFTLLASHAKTIARLVIDASTVHAIRETRRTVSFAVEQFGRGGRLCAANGLIFRDRNRRRGHRLLLRLALGG